MTATVRQIPEVIVEGKRLGRHVNHDDRSLQYLHADGTPTTVRWNREIPVLDQGNVGSCTGNACTGALGTDPDYSSSLAAMIAAGQLNLNEDEALALYSAAEVIDGDGPYPPNDNGSSGLSVAKAAKAAGYCSGYMHATSIAQAHTAIQTGPVMIGSNWYDSMDTPDENGLVTIAPGATVRGGHEYEAIAYDAATDLWELVNSWGESFGVKGHFFYSSATFERLLSEEGDVTSLVALSQPAPTPTPAPVPTPPAPPTPTPVPGPTPAPSGAPQTFDVEVHIHEGQGAVQMPIDPAIFTQIAAEPVLEAEELVHHPTAVVSPATGDPNETLITVTNAHGLRKVICTLTYIDPDAVPVAAPAPETFEVVVAVEDGEGWATIPVTFAWVLRVATPDGTGMLVTVEPASEDPEGESCVVVANAGELTEVRVVVSYLDPAAQAAA